MLINLENQGRLKMSEVQKIDTVIRATASQKLQEEIEKELKEKDAAIASVLPQSEASTNKLAQEFGEPNENS